MRDRRLQRTLRRMQRSTALSLLSEIHAQILELADDGLELDEIAGRLDLHPTAVQPLPRIARAKLAAGMALAIAGVGGTAWAVDTARVTPAAAS